MCSSSAPAAPTSATQYNTNIPEYAKPYVTNMLEATQQQLFNVDADKGITGFKPYQPYSNNMDNYFAGFSPMQKQAQQATANMQVPGQFGQASGLAGMSGLGSMAAGQQYGQQATDPNAVGRYMNPYLQNTLNPAMQLLNQQYGIAGQQGQGAATKGGAFGGNRATLANSLNQQNQMLAQNQLVGGAYNQAYNTANQNMQAAASQALQGYGQANTAAGTLANIGGQDLAAQQSIANAQNAMGAQQQGLEQNKINQAIQNYATQQQYPMMQLGMMSNMLRGLPMQSTTTQSYQAMPSTAQQLIGAAGTLGSTYQAFNPTPKKEGGVIKGLAHGGSVNSYAVGGEIKQQLSMMSDEQLQRIVQTSPSNEIRSMAGQILAEHKMAEQMTKNPEAGQGLMAANTGNTFDNMAGGGIIAFEEGSKEAIKNPEENYYYNPTTKRNELVQGRTETPMSDATREATAGLPVQKPADIGSQDLNTIIRGLQQSRTETGVAGAPRQAEKEMVDKRLAGLNAQEYMQKKLLQAQFFTGLATNPGGVIRGGLKSAEETLPKLAQLHADQAKIRDNYANIQANIAEADRLEKMGLVKEAEAIREKTNKEAGENRRADERNKNALEVANIGLKGTQYTADERSKAALKVAGIRTPKDKIDEIAFAAAAKNVAAEMSIAEGKPVSPQDSRVLEEAYRRLSGIKGLAGPKLESQEDSKGKTQLERALTDDKPYQTVRFQLSQAKEGSSKFAELQAKEKRMKQEIMDRLSKTTPAPKKEPGIGGDKAEKRPPLSNFQG